GLEERVAGGDFVLADGSVVGRHEGYPFYTVGQRRGLGLALGFPTYVTRIDAATNTVTVGPREELLGQTLTARQLNFVKHPDLFDERPLTGQIRYKDGGAPALAWQTGDDELRVTFAEPRAAITPGQSVVLYEDDDLVAGGWIHAVDGPAAGDGR